MATAGEGKKEFAGQFVRIGSKSDFDNLQGGKLVEVQGRKLAVFNLEGKLYAIDNACTHVGGPLAEGKVANGEVICPWHGSRFEIKTGAVTHGPARTGVKSHSVRVTGDNVEVDIG